MQLLEFHEWAHRAALEGKACEGAHRLRARSLCAYPTQAASTGDDSIVHAHITGLPARNDTLHSVRLSGFKLHDCKHSHNQAACFKCKLCHMLGTAFAPNRLLRRSHTASQASLPRSMMYSCNMQWDEKHSHTPRADRDNGAVCTHLPSHSNPPRHRHATKEIRRARGTSCSCPSSRSVSHCSLPMLGTAVSLLPPSPSECGRSPVPSQPFDEVCTADRRGGPRCLRRGSGTIRHCRVGSPHLPQIVEVSPLCTP
mmetsp:Transcript_23315/g.52951  ORF Transcript_23315/g.52951 Transcript_23315/m.52951 type:complete len:255 (+) Transcript_23315:148-912(+)